MPNNSSFQSILTTFRKYSISKRDKGDKYNPRMVNYWTIEVGHPRYILDLLLSVIRVSVETVQIVKGLLGLKG